MINVKFYIKRILFFSNYFKKIFIHNYSSLSLIPNYFIDAINFKKFEYIIKYRLD